MLRRSLRAALVLLATGALFAAGTTAAHADPFFPDPKTSVTVSRLTVTDGKGWLVLQPRIGHDQTIGFEVSIPAGDGSWSGPASIPVYDMGISCVRQAGPGLDYLCGSNGFDWENPPPLLPSGGYQITIPLTRTGSITGLTGRTDIWEENPFDGPYSFYSDSFPVVDGTHFRSTAEVRGLLTNLPVNGSAYDLGDIAVTLTAVPGERVHAIDVQLPPADWGIVAWQQNSWITCRLSGGPAAPLIHCASINSNVDFPAGRYPFVVKVRIPSSEDDSSGQDATVALTVNGAAPLIQDTFQWTSPFPY